MRYIIMKSGGTKQKLVMTYSK